MKPLNQDLCMRCVEWGRHNILRHPAVPDVWAGQSRLPVSRRTQGAPEFSRQNWEPGLERVGCTLWPSLAPGATHHPGHKGGGLGTKFHHSYQNSGRAGEGLWGNDTSFVSSTVCWGMSLQGYLYSSVCLTRALVCSVTPSGRILKSGLCNQRLQELGYLTHGVGSWAPLFFPP